MRSNDLPRVLIGPVCEDPAESVSSVNKAFVEGLSDQYEFVTPPANRARGNTKQARFNLWNLYYLQKHAGAWLLAVVFRRPAIAHYGITTGWALEKGLLFLGLARFFGAATVGHLHCGAFVEYWKGLSEKRRERLVREFSKMDGFVVLSEYWRKVVAELVSMPESKIFVVSNPIAGGFEKEALEMPVARDGNVILAMGVMGKDKGVLDIIAAAAAVRPEFRDFEIVIAGPEREPGILDEVREAIIAGSLESNITLCGGVWGDAKLDMFRRASMLLLPSYIENFPLVVLEGAAAGQAIITTPVGAVPEFFEDGVSALIVPAGNPDRLAEAMLRLLKDREARQKFGSESRKVFQERLGRTGIMRSLDRIYSAVLPKEFRSSVRTTGDGDFKAQVDR
jgi:glycosyltransferase involved in cell wall biosynthesis